MLDSQESSSVRETVVIANRIPATTVNRSRFRSTTVEPLIAEGPDAASEHVGETAAPPGMEQDQGDHPQ